MTRLVIAIAAALALGTGGMSAAQTITRADPEDAMRPQIAEAREQFLAGDYDASLAVLEPAANAGDPIAQNLMGVAFNQGRGRPLDIAQAAGWFTRAAEQGDPRAMVNLGRILSAGEGGVPMDRDAARRWFQTAADTGFVHAYAGLGRMLATGEGGPEDLDGARAYYHRATAAGDPWGAMYLAYVYRDGTGVPADAVSARALFGVAAQADLVGAQTALAYMLEHGQGGPADLDGALSWYRSAVDQGHGPAGFHLARMIRQHAPPGTTPAEAVSLCDWAQERDDEAQAAEWAEECDAIRAAAAASGK